MLSTLSTDALKAIPYPIAIVVVQGSDQNFYGQACVWHTQVSYDPVRWICALGHTRNTPQMVQDTFQFPMSINFVDDLAMVALFGRNSGRDMNKFGMLCPEDSRLVNGVRVLTSSKVAVIGKGNRLLDMGTHTMFELHVDHILEGQGKSFLTYDYGSV